MNTKYIETFDCTSMITIQIKFETLLWRLMKSLGERVKVEETQKVNCQCYSNSATAIT